MINCWMEADWTSSLLLHLINSIIKLAFKVTRSLLVSQILKNIYSCSCFQLNHINLAQAVFLLIEDYKYDDFVVIYF